MLCARCGAANPDGPDVRFCRACGAELTSAAPEAAPVPANVAEGYATVQAAPSEDRPNGQVLPTAPLAPVVRVAPAPEVVQVVVSPYGGFWVRLVAWAIDVVILIGTWLVSLFTIGFFRAAILTILEAEYDAGLPGAVSWVALLAVGIPFWLLFPPLLGGTPGKLMLGYHIVDERARHIGVKRSLGRMLAQVPSAMVLGLGYAWIGFDARKQGWHDQIARTFVIRKELVRP